MATFANVVQLYRACGKPPIAGSIFTYSGPASSDVVSAIEALSDLPPGLGRFEEPPEIVAGIMSFSWNLAAHDDARFYLSAEHLVRESNSLSSGQRPRGFYIVDLDFMEGETPLPQDVRRAFIICEMIGLLAKLALSRSTNVSRAQQLLFVLPAGEGKPPRTLDLKTQITARMLGLKEVDIEPLRNLVSEKSDSSIHVQEHRQLFRLAIADVLADDPSQSPTFEFLYQSWDLVLRRYAVNADCYVHKFSFDKLRRDLASNTLDFTNKLSKVLADATTKMLALPLSVAAIVAVQTSESVLAGTLIVVGSLILSVFLSGLIHNQLLELRQIRQSFSIVSGPLERNAKDVELRQSIDDAKTRFEDQARFLRRVLWTARVLAWAVTLAALALYITKFGNPSTDQ